MVNPYFRAPHQGGAGFGMPESTHAALLIDFDNVTMGMRSDLSKELKSLLASDVIKGKVSVQRAYADWRRYPQYIVPLSEASVDLIFAPAYGSSKKNATDIRMAIDAVELVFVRPEIGTFILLTGDSDFSSLVLKLKEYGKYVIGVGIQESTSDILVQNCDEYYSYTSLSGLRKTTEAGTGRPSDPWVLVKEALKRMVDRGDVMRSDRLKQVMQEIDPTFDEGGHGFSKFSKFLAEASSRGAVSLQKLDNGQYEVSLPRGSRSRRDDGEEREPRRERGRGRGERRERDGHDQRGARVEASDAPEATPAPDAPAAQEPAHEDTSPSDDPLRAGYTLLTRALGDLKESGRDPVRDSDVKRKMLDLDARFDETELGFPKFSKFLSQAEDHGVVRLIRNEAGNFEVTLDGAGQVKRRGREGQGRRRGRRDEPSLFEAVGEASSVASLPSPAPQAGVPQPEVTVVEIGPTDAGDLGLRLGPRRGSTRRRGEEDVVLLPGQAVHSSPTAGETRVREGSGNGEAHAGTATLAAVVPADRAGGFSAAELGLPTEPAAIVRYLTHRYRGVGEKTAESLVERFGVDLFRVLRDDPQAIHDAVTPKRAEQVLEAWKIDYERRAARRGGSGPEHPTEPRNAERGERGGRRGGRRRSPRGRSES